MSKSSTNSINLQAIALKLLANTNIKNKLDQKGTIYTAADLAGKIPELKSLGDYPLVNLKLDRNNQLSYQIPAIYRDGEQVVIVKPDLNRQVCDSFTVEKWQGGDINKATISNSQIKLQVAIAFTSDALENFKLEVENHVEGKDASSLKIHWLRPKPSIELPLKSLPIEKEYAILDGIVGKTKEYSTPMVNLQDSDGNRYLNVITNSQLRHLVDDGIERFRINSVTDTQASKGKSSRVLLEPIDNVDFSDLN